MRPTPGSTTDVETRHRPSLGAPASLPASPSSTSTSPWRSRGYLPHFDQPHLVQTLSFRLYDAVPEHVIESWKTALSRTKRKEQEQEIKLRKLIARYEDAGHGACWLRNPRIAALVEDALLHFDNQRYRLIAWCVMPNHVHGLIETWESWPLAGVLHSWKSYTALRANEILRRSGDFWFREYHDRFIRDGRHFRNAVKYIEQNPVKAGLVRAPEEWRWSSAWWEKVERGKKEDAGRMPAVPGE